MLGFRFPFPGGESYGYATLSGTSSITRGSVSVPEPGMLWLISLALGVIVIVRRRNLGLAR
jgi:hypothetical protein